MRLNATKDTHIGQRIGARSRDPDMTGGVAGLRCAAADVRLAIADAPHGRSRRDVRRPRPACFDTATTCRGADEVAAQAIDNEWGPGASETCGSVLNQAVNQPGDGLRG